MCLTWGLFRDIRHIGSTAITLFRPEQLQERPEGTGFSEYVISFILLQLRACDVFSPTGGLGLADIPL